MLNRISFFLFLFLFISESSLTYADQIDLYTPEGMYVDFASLSDEATAAVIAGWNYDTIMTIYLNDLNAEQIGDASQIYTCHGYAWSISEDNDSCKIAHPDAFFEDKDYSNDETASYLGNQYQCVAADEDDATHVTYYSNLSHGHSARKIQNNYPVAITTGETPITHVSGTRDYVAKWGLLGLVQHQKGHDPYLDKINFGKIRYFKLKTEHYGILEYDYGDDSYPKTWVGAGGQTHTISNNVTVSSGNLLKIKPGASVEFDAGKYLRIDGSLDAEGTSTDMITFDKSGASDWGGIRFYTNSDDDECKLIYCTIDHTSSYGVYCNSANPRIENCTISNSTSGIYLYNVDTPNARIKDNNLNNNTNGIYQYLGDTEITDNTISYCSKGLYLRYGDSKVTGNTISYTTGEGIKFDGQDGNLTHNDVSSNSGDGMYLVYYSMPYFRLSNQGSNVFINNTKNGVKIESTARPDMSAYSSPTTATNSFYGNGGAYYDVYSDQSSTVYAKYNYWGPGGGSIYGNVDTSYSRDSGPSKILAPASTPVPSNPNAQIILDEGFMLDSNENYDEAIVKFKTVISEYPESFEALMALRKLRTCFKRTERINEFESYLNSIYESNKNHLLGTKVLELQIPFLLNNKSTYAALTNCETIIKDFPDSEEAKHAQFAKWMIYSNETEDIVAAKNAMDDYGTKYPDDEDHTFMMLTMGEISPIEAPSDDSENTQPLSFEVSDNYPNPFNPETKIQIKLPKDSDVKLQIFNIRGQVVATPFVGNLPAGSHSIDFNASTLPSGTYFYKITAGEFTDVKKMVLVK